MKVSWTKIRRLTIYFGFGLLVGTVLFIFLDVNPLTAYRIMIESTLLSWSGFAETVGRFSTLLLPSLGIAVAFRCGVFNIGAPGQIYMGAIAATGVGIFFSGLSWYFLLPLVLLASFIAGAALAYIPAILKAKFQINEILVSLMLNFPVILFSTYLIVGPWRDRTVMEPQTSPIGQGAYLPLLFKGTSINASLIIGLAAAILLYFMFRKMALGFSITAVGKNPEASRFAGINTTATIVISMLISGGLAGLGGMGEICGTYHRLIRGFSPGFGFIAILIAILGKLKPLGVVASTFFFSVIMIGTDAIQREMEVPSGIVLTMQAILIIFIFLAGYLKNK